MIKLKITGMSCGHCEKAVTQALSGVGGVTQVVEVSHRQAQATVEGDADVRELIAAVEAEGYTAEVSR